MTHCELVAVQSRFDPRVTMDRLEQAIRDRGIVVFARIDFSHDASDVGMKLKFTELLLFGNPTVGTLLMQDDQRVGLDLPLKALVWAADDGATWVGFHDPRDFLSKYSLCHMETATKIQRLLLQTAEEAAGKVI